MIYNSIGSVTFLPTQSGRTLNLPRISDVCKDLGKQVFDQTSILMNYILSSVNLTEQELFINFPSLSTESVIHGSLKTMMPQTSIFSSSLKFENSKEFVLLFFHLYKTLQEFLNNPAPYPLCYKSHGYVYSLKNIFEFFKQSNLVLNSSQSTGVKTQTTQNGLIDISDKKLLGHFQLHIFFLRLVAEQFEEYVQDMNVRVQSKQAIFPRGRIPISNTETMNTIISASSIYTREIYEITNTMSYLLSSVEVLKTINKWVEVNGIDEMSTVRKVITMVKTEKWGLLKKGTLSLYTTDFFGVLSIGAQLFLFEGGLLVLVTKENSMEFKEWFPMESIVLGTIEICDDFPKECGIFAVVISSTEAIQIPIKVIGKESELLEWTSLVNHLKGTKTGKPNQSRPAPKRVRKMSFQGIRQSISRPNLVVKTEVPLSENVSIKSIIELLKEGFHVDATTKNGESVLEPSQQMSAFLKQIEKKNVLTKNTLEQIKGIKTKNFSRIKETLDLVLTAKSITQKNVILVHLFLLLMYSFVIDKKDGEKYDKHCADFLQQVTSQFFGDENFGSAFGFIVEHLPSIYNKKMRLYENSLMSIIIYLRSPRVEKIGCLHEKLFLFRSDGNVEIRNIEGIKETELNLTSKVFNVSCPENQIVCNTKSEIILFNEYKIIKRVKMIAHCVCATNEKIVAVTEEALILYDNNLNVINSVELEVEHPKLCFENNEYLCIACTQSQIEVFMTYNINLELIHTEEIVNNEAVRSVIGDEDFVYVGTENGRLLQYHRGILMCEKMLNCGAITSVTKIGYNLYVFGTLIPLVVVYYKNLITLQMGTLLGLNSCESVVMTGDLKRKVVEEIHDDQMESPRTRAGTVNDKGIVEKKVTEKRRDVWVINTTGCVARFVTYTMHHRRFDTFSETNKFVGQHPTHCFCEYSIGLCEKCFICGLNGDGRKGFVCKVCGEKVHQGCLDVGFIMKECKL
ncbi:hypothetical protein EIN_053980 [Entamoeba invadens IP1]|uniref:hypothetical protein n=1 Tax=Entamoeba invadens IP1 TaxID=370355 RepID=UPI0002C3D6EB|nr:hypothetical protein EIN_053980 [Entamoeba invadens IP1]ELP93133.1 hypothetical protein EIN_053980 [Entamoeba invadens IP1]|eukprot:XP_004259904.1 hypothetical protein EIN_053980 [Entamoeba invadens IP1]